MPTSDSAPPVLTREELARELHLSRTTIDQLLRNGSIAFFRCGRAIRIPRESVQLYLRRAMAQTEHGEPE